MGCFRIRERTVIHAGSQNLGHASVASWLVQTSQLSNILASGVALFWTVQRDRFQFSPFGFYGWRFSMKDEAIPSSCCVPFLRLAFLPPEKPAVFCAVSVAERVFL